MSLRLYFMYDLKTVVKSRMHVGMSLTIRSASYLLSHGGLSRVQELASSCVRWKTGFDALTNVRAQT